MTPNYDKGKMDQNSSVECFWIAVQNNCEDLKLK